MDSDKLIRAGGLQIFASTLALKIPLAKTSLSNLHFSFYDRGGGVGFNANLEKFTEFNISIRGTKLFLFSFLFSDTEILATGNHVERRNGGV